MKETSCCHQREKTLYGGQINTVPQAGTNWLGGANCPRERTDYLATDMKVKMFSLQLSALSNFVRFVSYFINCVFEGWN